MIEYSSTTLAFVFTALINPHPNITLVSDAIYQDDSFRNNYVIKQSIWEKFYNKSRSFNLRYTLRKQAKTMSKDVINKVVTSLHCAEKYHIEHKPILTVIDYSLPSNQKRLWVFDLDRGKLLYHTYVGHGITSGSLLTNHFSNRNNSKATSMGVYVTDKAYYGREGISMRLTGIDNRFNNNAANRYIVMHGGWYMDPQFIEQYGRSGRSWGCPALPKSLTKEIINTIKDKTFMVMYYPSERWFAESRFLTCDKPKTKTAKKIEESLEPIDVSKEERDTILFAPFSKEKAILVIQAQQYSNTFKLNPPLKRMLRRRIGSDEYIALSTNELEHIIANGDEQNSLEMVKFVIPVVRNNRGYYQTFMEFVKHDKITSISVDENKSTDNKYVIPFTSGKNMHLSTSNHFIRWLGL